jgi:hypothetical protein
MIKKLIHCSKYKQVIPKYKGYAVTQAQSSPGVEWSGADLAKAQKFLFTHSGHPLEELSIQTDSLISEKPAYEPIAVTYVFASKVDISSPDLSALGPEHPRCRQRPSSALSLGGHEGDH